MFNINKIIDALKTKSECILGDGTDASLIVFAEQVLKLQFANDFKDYLSDVGIAAYDGHELTGISKSSRTNVVYVTKKEWECNPKINHKLYVIEQANFDGIVIWQSKTGEIYQSMPNQVPRKIYNSLYEYITL